MRCGRCIRCVVLGLLQALSWSFSLGAKSSQDKGCPFRPTEDSHPTVVIDSIEFQEGPGLAPELLERLGDQLKGRSFSVSSVVDDDWQGELGDEIRTAVQEQGFFKVLVDVSGSLIRADANRLHYWVSVGTESGSQYRLGAVRFENAPEFSATELRAQVPVQPGDLFNASKIREGLDHIRRLYVQRGYIDLTIEAETDIDENDHRIDLTLKVDPGVQYRVGHVEIRDFSKAAEKLLRSKLETGVVFDGTALNEIFVANKGLLPVGATVENTVSVARDAHSHTVSIVLEPHVCPRV